jgi:hypothetical protein
MAIITKSGLILKNASVVVGIQFIDPSLSQDIILVSFVLEKI